MGDRSVSIKGLKEQVREDRDRFPQDFMFRLAQEEKKELITNCDRYVLRLKSRLWRDAPRGPEARSLSEALSVSLMAGPDGEGNKVKAFNYIPTYAHPDLLLWARS